MMAVIILGSGVASKAGDDALIRKAQEIQQNEK